MNLHPSLQGTHTARAATIGLAVVARLFTIAHSSQPNWELIVDIRAEAALALYEAARGTSKEPRVREALKRVAVVDESDYVRVAALKYLRKLDQQSSSDARS